MIVLMVLVLGAAAAYLVISSTRSGTETDSDSGTDVPPVPVRRIAQRRDRGEVSTPMSADMITAKPVITESANNDALKPDNGAIPSISPSQMDESQIVMGHGSLQAQRNVNLLEIEARRLIEHGVGNVVLDLPPIVPIQPLVRNLTRIEGRRFQLLTRFDQRASLIGGSTIHSFFRLPDQLDSQSPIYNRPLLASVFEEVDTFVIDSMSSVEAHLLYAMDWCLRRTLGSNEPFGGKRVVMIGSSFDVTHFSSENLTPRSNADMTSYPVTKSSSFIQGKFKKHDIGQLLDCYSYSDRGRSLIQAIINGRVGNSDIKSLTNDASSGLRHHVTCVRDRKTADRLNTQRLKTLSTTSKVYKAWSQSEDEADSFPAPSKLELRLDAIIIFLSTNPEAGWHRGMFGMVKGLYDAFVVVQTEKNQIVRVEAEAWQQCKLDSGERGGEFVYRSTKEFQQMPIQLGWYVSIDSLVDMQIRNIQFSDTAMRPLHPGELLWALLHVSSEDRVKWPRNLALEETLTHPMTSSQF
ncbi:MAG: hypothetical protein FGM32_09060 [Candidatus Kapabacteria bacterium]|nr:hypothetical protein [Candidatus Kapabacteria bacterium]